MKKIVIVLSLIMLPAMILFADDKKTTRKEKKELREARVKQIVEEQNYEFGARVAMPLNETAQNLTPGFFLKVTKDEITSYLPYFGTSHTPMIGNQDIGIKFSAKNFEYRLEEVKKGWNIIIRVKTDTETYSMILLVSKSGSSSLKVNSTKSQPISFNGYIE